MAWPCQTAQSCQASTGTNAAREAGMRVVGFTGASHTYPSHADRLTDAGAETVIARMQDLPGVIAAMAEWEGAF